MGIISHTDCPIVTLASVKQHFRDNGKKIYLREHRHCLLRNVGAKEDTDEADSNRALSIPKTAPGTSEIKILNFQ
jgi:hypothetical protein